jgi:hypothetical protein
MIPRTTKQILQMVIPCATGRPEAMSHHPYHPWTACSPEAYRANQRGPPEACCPTQQADQWLAAQASSSEHATSRPVARCASQLLGAAPAHSAAPQRHAANLSHPQRGPPAARCRPHSSLPTDADQLPHANPGIPMSHYKGYKSFARSIQRSCERIVKPSERRLQRLRRQGTSITREDLKDHQKVRLGPRLLPSLPP